jgi:Fe-S-cluster-containing hydrogenase component 2
LSGVRVQKLEEKWVTGESSWIYSRNLCTQCGLCIDICPSGAISRDPPEGAVVVDQEKCIRCKLCVKACPNEAVWFNEEEYRTVKCDLCKGVEGGPKCVEWCPWQLYRYVEVERYAEERGMGIPQR